MEQVIIGGTRNLLDTTLTEYNTLTGTLDWSSSSDRCRQVISTGGKLKNLRVKLSGSPGAGTSYAFTLMVNGAPTALTLTIADAATSGADTTHEVDVVAGDLVGLRCVPTGTPTAREAYWTSMFKGSTPKESLILGSTGNRALSNSNDTYVQIASGDSNPTVTENDHREVCPTSGKIKNLYVQLRFAPGTAPDAYRFTLRVNGANSDDGEGNPLQVTIVADDTTGNDTAHEITVAAGDILTMIVEPLDTPLGAPQVCWGMTFEADIDGESIILGGTSSSPNPAASVYIWLTADDITGWDGTEAFRYQLAQECTLKKLYLLLSAAPGDGKSYTFTLRKPGNGQADGNLTVTITGAATTTGNDTVNTDAIADDDYVDLESTPAGTPDATDAYWGLVSYREPPVGLENKSANMGSKMVGAGLI